MVYTQPLHLKGECSSKRWRKHTDTQKTTMSRGDGGVIWPQAKEIGLEPPGAGRGRKVQPLTPLQGAWPCWSPDFRLPVPGTVQRTSLHLCCGEPPHVVICHHQQGKVIHATVSENGQRKDLVMPILQQTGRVVWTGGQSSCVVAVLS